MFKIQTQEDIQPEPEPEIVVNSEIEQLPHNSLIIETESNETDFDEDNSF